jgi:hypothetical protein
MSKAPLAAAIVTIAIALPQTAKAQAYIHQQGNYGVDASTPYYYRNGAAIYGGSPIYGASTFRQPTYNQYHSFGALYNRPMSVVVTPWNSSIYGYNGHYGHSPASNNHYAPRFQYWR